MGGADGAAEDEGDLDDDAAAVGTGSDDDTAVGGGLNCARRSVRVHAPSRLNTDKTAPDSRSSRARSSSAWTKIICAVRNPEMTLRGGACGWVHGSSTTS